MDQAIIDFLDSVPEPSQDTIIGIPPDIYKILVDDTVDVVDMMQGIDAYAYISMVTYVDARYQDFPATCWNYVVQLLSNYNSAMTSINMAVSYIMFNVQDPRMDKFRRIVYWNWINVNKLFKSTIIDAVYSSTITDVLDLGSVEQAFRARYPY